MEQKASVLVVVGVFVVGFIAAAMLLAVPIGSTGPVLTGAMIQQMPCMSTDGFVETTVDVGISTIHLESGCRRLVMSTNALQTYSINTGINEIRGARPTTHDTIKDMMETFEMRPLIVKITSLSQGTYFAKMAVTQGSKVLDMDIRPSDAIAIAVRTGTPVYVNVTLLEENGEFIC